ncbi:MAG: SurA N-terminal domain-containing protein [Flavobacteriaceae bacterium]|nr:SurA N-terminal domain-containing protein [Flavobacteriaceae bacterium]
MAILSKIREKSVYLIIVIGLALFAFVVSPSKIGNFFSSSGVNEVGEINGEEINRKDFAQMLENYQARTGGRISQTQATKAVWNGLVREKVFENQLKKAGIVVGEKDIWDAMVAMPSIQQAPLFKNEAGLFSEEKLKEYVANLKAEYDAGNKQGWLSWLQTEQNIKNQLQQSTYTSMLANGLGASLKESMFDYQLENTKIDAQYVYVPYTTIPDADVKVSEGEVKKYVESHPKEFKKEASRSLKYVTFAITPSEEDEKETKNKVASFISDREEYNPASKSKVMVKGFKNATNLKSFFEVNGSDINFNDSYYYENELPKVSDWNAVAVNEVVGPYKDKGFFKLSKVTAITQLPDSVKARHILIPFVGSRAANAETKKTEEQAKKFADSLLAVVKKSPKNFEKVAKDFSKGPSASKGGDLGWFTYKTMVPEFRDYCFLNKKGDMGVVKTIFGFHIIKIDDQKNIQKAIKLVTFGRAIEPSEATENDIFQKAETLASNLHDGKKLEELAKEQNYFVQNAENLKVLDEAVPGIGNQRQIVSWAYKSDRNVGDSKRFDIEYSGKRGYVVVELTQKVSDDEVAVTGNLLNRVTPILRNEKKAKIIADKISGSTLEEIAKSTQQSVRNVSGVTFASPLLSGIGNEPKVVGAMSGIPVGKVSGKIDGQKGVFVVKVTNRTEAVKLDNYSSYQEKRKNSIKGGLYKVFDVLKDKADIVDGRAKFF